MLRRLIVKVRDEILINVIRVQNNKIKYEKDYFRRRSPGYYIMEPEELDIGIQQQLRVSLKQVGLAI